MSSKVIPLHTHSHYSFLDAIPKVEDLIKEAKKQGLSAMALTDMGNLHGAIDFYKRCKKAGIQPIIGVELFIAPASMKDPHERETTLERIVLLAQNMDGYKNLLKLITKAHTEGFHEVPRVDTECLRTHSNGLIAISPAHHGIVIESQKKGDSTLHAILAEYRSMFPHFFIEITHHPELKGHTETMNSLIALAKKEGIDLVAGQEIYYMKEGDHGAREVMKKIREGHGGENGPTIDLSFRNMETLAKSFSHIKEAVENTEKIRALCSLDIPIGMWVFPNLPLKEGRTYGEELHDFAYRGFDEKGFKRDDTESVARLEYELKVIEDKGFSPYFLVVSDLLQEAKRRGILTTTRGSAAGSFVSYLTGITNIDPLEYRLPFERFLNPERPKAPDIDMDFADNRRDEIISYAKEKYGDDHVAQIGTFGTMMARAAVRDIARALGHPYGVGDRIAKMIPFGSQGHPMTLEHAMDIEPDLKTLYKTDEDVREIIDLALTVEGCARHMGVHAAGVVIAPTPLTEWTALQKDPKGGKLITQYDMHSIEDVGLLKFDFLGIKNLSILSASVHNAKRIYGVDVDIEHIPVDDPTTFEMLAKGETEGLFQLNGSGMTRYLKELRPTSIHDINVMVALYRPGPMESIPQYIERKRNPSLITYIDPRMESILNQSYGVIAYQDDVLMIAIEIAGYSWGEADTLRKAMGKKIPEEMEAQHEQFVLGAVKKGMDKKKADTLWKLIEPFAGYGFNKAHAASYGRVAYQTAYMKANFPVAYMNALLSADAGDVEKISIIVNECRRMGIEVLPPDVNESEDDFTIIDKHKIRFGLVSIKNFGAGVAEAIMKARGNTPFKDLRDFLTRVPSEHLHKRALESLTKAGALDSLAPRAHILASLPTILTFAKESNTRHHSHDSLFGDSTPPATLSIEEVAPLPLHEVLSWEKDLLGMYVSGHPLDAYPAILSKSKISIASLLETAKQGLPFVIPAVLETMKSMMTQGGEKMAFATFGDKTGSIEGVLFPKVLKKVAPTLTEGTPLLLKGTISLRNGEKSILVEEIRILSR